MKIILERNKCIGDGTCVALCPKFFEIAEDGKATLKDSKKNEKTGNFELEVESPEDLQCIKEAAEICPIQIIKIIE